MGDNVTLTLPSLFVGQLLDALREQLDVWRYTEKYMSGDCIAESPYLIKECSNANEAQNIVNLYERIIETVERQIL